MPIASRSKRVSGALTATFDEGTPLTSASKIYAVIDRNTTTAPTQATLEAAGWTFLDSIVSTASSGVNCGMWIYYRDGNGTVNSITVDGTASGTNITLLGATGYAGGTPQIAEAQTVTPTLGTDIDIATTLTTTEASELAWTFWRIGNTAGGTTFALTNGYAILAGASGSSTGGYGEKNMPTAGSAGTTVSWTTTGRPGVAMTLAAKTVNPAPPADVEYFLWTAAKDLSVPIELVGEWV